MISDRIIISSDESMIDYMGKYNMKKAGISLKKQLLIIFLFIAFIPMTVTALLLYHFQTQNALNAEIESQIQVLKLVTSNIYQKLTYFNNLTASIYYNDDIMSCLEKGQATLLSSPDKKRIQPAIDSLMRTDDMILSVSLTTMAGDTLYWNDGYSNAIHINSLDPDFLQKIYAHNGSGVLSNPITHTSKRKYPASNTSIYYGRLLRSLTHNFRPIGILLVEVDITSFEDILIFSNFSSDSTFFLTTQNNTLIWGYQEENLNYHIGDIISTDVLGTPPYSYSVVTINGEKYYRFNSQIDTLEYNCYSFLPFSNIESKTQFIKTLLLLICGVDFLCLCLIFFMLTKQFITPIRRLSVIMQEQDYLNYFPSPVYPVHNEIGNLYDSFQSMSQRTLTLVEQLKEYSKKEAKQQLALLHAQLNPHFLYNTLDSISWMSQNGNADKVPYIINALSDILRYSIIKENDFVTINDELSWLKNYMYIQKIRFQDSFTIHYHIEPDMQSYKIPRFILQPFIENSLLHGFSEIHQGGIIILSIFTKDNSIFITIEDNGKGMSDLLIHSVLHGKNDGIGIGNTNTYLKQRFGQSYGIEITSRIMESTKVIIKLPVQK